MTIAAVDPIASPDAERARVLALVHAGLPLCVKDLAVIVRVSASQIHRREKTGAYVRLLLPGAFPGPKRYSGVLVGRWLRGEPLVDIGFGRKTFRKRA